MATVRWLLSRLSYPARHIRWKIIAPYAILTIVLAAAGTYIATSLVSGSLEERFENQLAESARVTSDSVVRRERAHLELVRAASFTNGVAEAAADGDDDALSSLLEPLAANAGAELIEVVDLDGRRVFGAHLVDAGTRTYEAIEDETDRGSWAVVSSVLAGREDALGDKFAQIVETAYGYAFYSAGPVYEGDELVGAVLVGSRLASFLPAIKGEALADVTFYDFDGSLLATTFADEGGETADLTANPDIVADPVAPTALRESTTLFGRDFDLLYGEIVIRDQVVGLYSVGLPSSFILNASGTTQWQMGLLFSVATAVVLATGWALARSLTKPLLRLVGAARAVTSGDLTARSGVTSADEIGTLAASFDTMAERLQRQHLATIRALTSAIDARDPYTAGHSARVGQLAVTIGEALGLPESQLQHLEIGGYLHDIGKIGVRDSVLLKPGRLTPEEREQIERHPYVGLNILKPVELAPEVISIVSNHHEKLDGSGYPAGRTAEELTIIARIAVVADMYDALTTGRPYRGPMPIEQALAIMRREGEDGKLDTAVLRTFESLIPRWEERRRTDPDLKGFRLPDTPGRQAA